MCSTDCAEPYIANWLSCTELHANAAKTDLKNIYPVLSGMCALLPAHCKEYFGQHVWSCRDQAIYVLLKQPLTYILVNLVTKT